MNKKVLNTAFTGFIKRLEATEKFVVDQAPEICQQMIREVYITNITNLILSTIGIIVLPIISYKVGTYAHERIEDVGGWWLLSVLAGSLSIVALFGVFDAIGSIIFVKSCPKLFLLRSFRDLIN